MSEKIKSDGISRRSVFLLFGLAAAFGLAAPATMLAVSDAEAQADNPPPQRRPARNDVTSGANIAGSDVRSGTNIAASGVRSGALAPTRRSNSAALLHKARL